MHHDQVEEIKAPTTYIRFENSKPWPDAFKNS